MSEIVTIDETGTLKVICHRDRLATTACVTARWTATSRSNTPYCFSIETTPNSHGDFLIPLGLRNGNVNILDGLTGEPIATAPTSAQNRNPIEKITCITSLTSGNLVAGTASGALFLMRRLDQRFFQETEYQIRIKKLQCLSVWHGESEIAIAGEGRGLMVFDARTGQSIYKAIKGKEKPCLTCATHLSKQSIVVGTYSHEIRLYDIRAGKRHVLGLTCGDARLNCAITDKNTKCWVGNSVGEVRQWDLTANKLTGTQRQNLGEVTSLDKHPTAPIIASVGRDCWLRIFNYGIQQIIAQANIGRGLKTVRFGPSTEKFRCSHQVKYTSS